MKQGARASTGKTDLSNCLFAVYELAGLTGLGPGRLEIRSSPVKAFLPFVIPLVIHACLAAYVLVSGVRFIVAKAPARIWLGVTACVGATAAFLFAAGVVMHFRVLGRHFAPLAACFMLATSLGLHRLWDAGGWRRLCAGLFLVISLASAVSSRIAPRHAKDDYREAVAVAQAALARGDRVWWCADGNAAAYYGLVLTDEPVPNGAKQAWLVYNFSASASKNQPEPDLVVFSKPDLYDSQGAVQDYLARERYRIWRPLQAFSLWKKPPEQR
jgi:hypothetical protein